MDNLRRAGQALRKARANLGVATYEAKVAANDAAANGTSEVTIARLLGIDRLTARKWIGKPRKPQ